MKEKIKKITRITWTWCTEFIQFCEKCCAQFIDLIDRWWWQNRLHNHFFGFFIFLEFQISPQINQQRDENGQNNKNNQNTIAPHADYCEMKTSGLFMCFVFFCFDCGTVRLCCTTTDRRYLWCVSMKAEARWKQFIAKFNWKIWSQHGIRSLFWEFFLMRVRFSHCRLQN